jgi:SpoIID/LytB domain protein
VKVRIAVVAAFAVIASLLQLMNAPAASAYPTANVELAGHGFGHGRGLSQYGSYGYALSGWSWQQITDHYYGGTSNVTGGDPDVRVRITANDGVTFIVGSQSSYSVGGQSFGANRYALVSKVGSNSFQIYESGGCGGDGGWASRGTFSGPITAQSSVGNPGNAEAGLLDICQSVGLRGVRGTLTAVDDGGTQRLVNQLSSQNYLRGVVPRESPASWGDGGGGAGMNALRSQAVAARSYALSSHNYAYADICDSTACQVYGGEYLNHTRIEDSRTDQAVGDTAGVVREFGNGTIAHTEFSSSSGGFTAGGTFPAVVDDGDGNPAANNPNHDWTASIPVSSVESAYPSIGSLQSISITSRNGLGDWGGRVTGMTLLGSNGSVNLSGDDFRVKFGLKSNWFQVLYQPSGGVNGYWQLGSDGGIFTFGNIQFYGSMGGHPLNSPLIALEPTADTHGYWLVGADGGVFSFGNAQFEGSMGGHPLNQPVVGLATTPSGNGYWEVAKDGGIFAFGDAQFYGSMGGTRLNKPVVGMAATPSGHGYWLVAADGGIFAFGDAQFAGSTGSLKLVQPIVGMSPTSTGQGYWMVASDGGIFAFGNAGFFGALPGTRINGSVTGMSPTRTGQGYLMTTSKGAVYSFGDAPQFGSVASAVPNFRATVLGVAAGS